MARGPVPPEDRKWLRPKEVSDLFGVNKETLRGWANDGKLEVTYTFGRHRRYNKAQVLELIGLENDVEDIP